MLKGLFKIFTNKQNKNMSTWPTVSATWPLQCFQLLIDGSTNQAPNTSLREIKSKSLDFPIKFPVTSITNQHLSRTVSQEILERNFQSVYPIIHEKVLKLCAEFLLFKLQYGSSIEQKIYKDMSVVDFISRLLNKRPCTFMTSADSYLLLDKTKGVGNWESVGTDREHPPLILQNCLSYDEIKLSAFLSVSSYTYSINDGERFNKGKVQEDRSKLQEEGVIIGLIGTRLEKEDVMEYQEIVISKTQNRSENGYGKVEKLSLHKLFADFYQEDSFTYKDVVETKNKRFVKMEEGLFFDNVAYAKRLALTFDTLLLEANHRAKERNLSAYIHVVGLGLGVWKISEHQKYIFVQTFIERLSFLGKKLSNVSDVHFAYFSNLTNCSGFKNGDTFPVEGHPNKGITIHISRREPFTKLADKEKLLIVSYAWDGNALPGNEFWIGILASTGDCAAAASTQIAELHNPHINSLVCGENLRVATISGQVLPLVEYIDYVKSNNLLCDSK